MALILHSVDFFFHVLAQVWLCGGSVEIIPCSKIAHIERGHKPYVTDLNNVMMRNALRVAEVWMDEYKINVNIAWGLPIQVDLMKGDSANQILDFQGQF